MRIMAVCKVIWRQSLIMLGLVILTTQSQRILSSSPGTSPKCTFKTPPNVRTNHLNHLFDKSQDLVHLAVRLQNADSSLSYLEHEDNIVDSSSWVLARKEKGIALLSFPFDVSMLSLGVVNAGNSLKVPLDIEISDMDLGCFYRGSDSERLYMLADILLNTTMYVTNDTAQEQDTSICLERHSDGKHVVVDILLGTHITLQMNTFYSCWKRGIDGNLVTFDIRVSTPWLRCIMNLEPQWYHDLFIALNLLWSTLFVYKSGGIRKVVARYESRLDTFIRCARFLCLIHIIPTAVYILTHYEHYCQRKAAAMKANGSPHRGIDILHFFLCICVIQIPNLYKRSKKVFSRRTLMTGFFILSVFILTSVNVLYVVEVIYFTCVGLQMYPQRVWLVILLAIRSILIVRAVVDVHRFLRFDNNGLSLLQFVIKRGTRPEFSIFFALSLIHTCADPQTLSPVTISLLAALFINWIRYILTPSEYRYNRIESIIHLAKETLDSLGSVIRLGSTYGDETRLFAAAYFDSRGGFLSIDGTGVGLFIHPGALSREVFVYLYIIDEEEDVEGLEDRNGDVLSPLVCCGPPGLQFNDQILLYMPHCANIEHSSDDTSDWLLEASFCRQTSSKHYSNWTAIDPTDMEIFKKWFILRVDHFTRFTLFGFKRSGRQGRKLKRVGCFGKTFPRHAKTYRFRLWFCDDTHAAFKKVCREEDKFPGWRQQLPYKRLTVHRTQEDVLVNIMKCKEGWDVRGESQICVPFSEVWRRGRQSCDIDLDFKGTDPAHAESIHCTVLVGQTTRTIELKPQPDVVNQEKQGETHRHRMTRLQSICEKLYPDISRISLGRLHSDAFIKILISLDIESDRDWRLIGPYMQERNLDDTAGENATIDLVTQRFRNSSPGPALYILEHYLECVENQSLSEGRNYDLVESLRELFTNLQLHEALYILKSDLGEM